MNSMPVPIPPNDAIWWYPAAQADGRDLLRIIRQDRRLTIEFNGQMIGENTECLADIRQEMFDLLASADFDCLIIDLTGVKVVPSGLLEILSTAAEHDCEVELLNPSPEFLQILRAATLDISPLIRGTTCC